MPPPIADPSSVLLLMMPLIADAAAFYPPGLLCSPDVLLYFADLDALCRLRLPMQPPLALLLLLMPRPIADSSFFLLLIVPLIADPAAF